MFAYAWKQSFVGEIVRRCLRFVNDDDATRCTVRTIPTLISLSIDFCIDFEQSIGESTFFIYYYNHACCTIVFNIKYIFY